MDKKKWIFLLSHATENPMEVIGLMKIAINMKAFVLIWIGQVVSLLKAHYELALAYHDKGMQAKADEHMQTALSIWKNADDEFRPAAEARATAAQWESAASM